ncbi:hypothetical protein D3C81_1804450 [compost metagenome]
MLEHRLATAILGVARREGAGQADKGGHDREGGHEAERHDWQLMHGQPFGSGTKMNHLQALGIFVIFLNKNVSECSAAKQ